MERGEWSEGERRVETREGGWWRGRERELSSINFNLRNHSHISINRRQKLA